MEKNESMESPFRGDMMSRFGTPMRDLMSPLGAVGVGPWMSPAGTRGGETRPGMEQARLYTVEDLDRLDGRDLARLIIYAEEESARLHALEVQEVNRAIFSDDKRKPVETTNEGENKPS